MVMSMTLLRDVPDSDVPNASFGLPEDDKHMAHNSC